MHEINCNPENISNRICADLDLTLARNLNKELECKLQQLKQENEELHRKNTHYNYLISAYHVCFEGALGAMQALLKNNCDNPKYWASVAKTYLGYRYEEQQEAKNIYDKHFSELKAENEKLKQDLQKESDLGHKAMCDEADMAWEVTKLQKVLDEIEEICKECHKHDYDLCCICKYADNCRTDDGYTSYDIADYIHSIIKQAKEGGE